MSTYTTIKPDVTFDITVGGSTLISFQKLLLFLLADKTEEEIQEAYQKILNKEFDEEWIQHYAFLAYMIQYLERVAVEKGLATQEDLTTQQDS
jgi:hypothetical protein